MIFTEFCKRECLNNYGLSTRMCHCSLQTEGGMICSPPKGTNDKLRRSRSHHWFSRPLIHKGYFLVKKLMLNVRIKYFWSTNLFNPLFLICLCNFVEWYISLCINCSKLMWIAINHNIFSIPWLTKTWVFRSTARYKIWW